MALLAFAQASVALAACSMDRGGMAQMVTVGDGCGDCNAEVKTYVPQYANRCVAHCTADLQLNGLALALVRGPADAPVLLVPRVEPRFLGGAGLEAPPPGAVPPRILLHSFLI
jgi:hypothetical protein